MEHSPPARRTASYPSPGWRSGGGWAPLAVVALLTTLGPVAADEADRADTDDFCPTGDWLNCAEECSNKLLAMNESGSLYHAPDDREIQEENKIEAWVSWAGIVLGELAYDEYTSVGTRICFW